MASHAGTFRGLPAEEARGYLVISPSISSMPAVAKRRIPLPEAIRAPYLTQGKDDGGIADGSPGGLQSGTTQFESLPSVLPESDATASEGVLKTAAARGSGERVTKGDDVITKDQALMGAMVAFQAVTAALVGLFWWSYTSTVADVSALPSALLLPRPMGCRAVRGCRAAQRRHKMRPCRCG